MTTPDYKALCAELADIVTAHASPNDDAVGYVAAVLTRARAALAPQPVPEAPSDEELNALLQSTFAQRLYSGVPRTTLEIDFARAVLARWGHPRAAAPAPGAQPRAAPQAPGA